MSHYLYLHGWASSPSSTKAVFFQQQFAACGIELHIPDLNQADFYHLTFSRQLQQVAALLPDAPVTVIGSSLGGLTALWLAQHHSQIERLLLLAPALNFIHHCQRIIGADEWQTWQEQGELPIYHYAEQREMLLSYEFIRDMLNYQDADLIRELPTLILHGKFDDVILIESSRQFAETRSWLELREYDDDHSLANVLPQLWNAGKHFLKIS